MPERIALTDMSVKALKAPTTGQVTFWDRNSPIGVRVSQGGSKTFIALLGRGQRHTIGRYPIVSLLDARNEAKRVLAEKTLGLSKPKSMAFDEAKAIYLDRCKRDCKPRTAHGYERLLDRHFPFGGKRLGEITPQDVLKFTDKLKEQPGEQAHAIVAFKVFMSWCVKRYYIPSSPCQALQAPKSTARDRVLSDHELKCIWQACELMDGQSARIRCGGSSPEIGSAPVHQPVSPTFAAIVKLLILTGQRRGEIAGLQTSWIKKTSSPSSRSYSSSWPSSETGSPLDTSSDLWTITLPKEITKNGRDHVFPISTTARFIIGSLQTASGSAFLCPARGDLPRPFNGFSKAKATLDKKLGPDFKPWTLHDLRRTFATNLAALGVRMEVTERLLNHVSGSSGGLVAVYQRHHFRDEMRAAIELWETRLKQIVDAA